jgi:hypothetical protein
MPQTAVSASYLHNDVGQREAILHGVVGQFCGQPKRQRVRGWSSSIHGPKSGPLKALTQGIFWRLEEAEEISHVAEDEKAIAEAERLQLVQVSPGHLWEHQGREHVAARGSLVARAAAERHIDVVRHNLSDTRNQFATSISVRII